MDGRYFSLDIENSRIPEIISKVQRRTNNGQNRMVLDPHESAVTLDLLFLTPHVDIIKVMLKVKRLNYVYSVYNDFVLLDPSHTSFHFEPNQNRSGATLSVRGDLSKICEQDIHHDIYLLVRQHPVDVEANNLNRFFVQVEVYVDDGVGGVVVCSSDQDPTCATFLVVGNKPRRRNHTANQHRVNGYGNGSRNEMFDEVEDEASGENLDDSQKCIVCMTRPKNATIVHQRTGHICCCLRCANTLQQRGDKCPICRAHIDTVSNIIHEECDSGIKHYYS